MLPWKPEKRWIQMLYWNDIYMKIAYKCIYLLCFILYLLILLLVLHWAYSFYYTHNIYPNRIGYWYNTHLNWQKLFNISAKHFSENPQFVWKCFVISPMKWFKILVACVPRRSVDFSMFIFAVKASQITCHNVLTLKNCIKYALKWPSFRNRIIKY